MLDADGRSRRAPPGLLKRATRSEVEQEPEGLGNCKQGLVAGRTEAGNQALLRYRLDVLAFRVARLVEPRFPRFDLDMGRKLASSRGAGNDNDDAGGTLVQAICGDHHAGSSACLLGSDGFTEVDQPHLAAARRHADRSRSA